MGDHDMTNQLGTIIGVIESGPFGTTLASGDKITMSIKFDFSTTSDDDIKRMLLADRKIAVQRPIRMLTASAAQQCRNMMVLAHNAGAKIETPETMAKNALATMAKLGFTTVDEYVEYLKSLVDPTDETAVTENIDNG